MSGGISNIYIDGDKEREGNVRGKREEW